jgi:hypothetical protein
MNFIRFGKGEEHITEVVDILKSSGMTDGEVFLWLERRLQIGRFAKVKR